MLYVPWDVTKLYVLWNMAMLYVLKISPHFRLDSISVANPWSVVRSPLSAFPCL